MDTPLSPDGFPAHNLRRRVHSLFPLWHCPTHVLYGSLWGKRKDSILLSALGFRHLSKPVCCVLGTGHGPLLEPWSFFSRSPPGFFSDRPRMPRVDVCEWSVSKGTSGVALKRPARSGCGLYPFPGFMRERGGRRRGAKKPRAGFQPHMLS